MKKYILLSLVFSLFGCVAGQFESDRTKLYDTSIVCEDEESPDCYEGARI
ncbi:MAG: hypothetical protein PHE89_03620 [Alphaproteobacteria bacterium]|nr:hypothetical protein [Alphaproteobacteria bacterium]